MKKDNKEVKEVARVISNTMERDLTKVQEVLDLDLNDLIQIVDRLDKSDQDEVYSIMINNELNNFKSMSIEQFKSVARDVDEITDYYASKKEEFDAVIEEGDTVANDILFKVIGKNGRKLSLPIDISIIKEYCFSTELKEEQFYDALMWITLRYIAISRCISWNKWLKEYEKNKELENNSSN
ncbi:MAG: hypothetical protein IJ068_01980 [Bacilli bacterium]|nr:hypothetical protein [Bacilli bacterium]